MSDITSMDPLSTTVGALGITGVASTGFRQLRNIIQGLTEAHEAMRDISSNLDDIPRALAALQELTMADERTSIEIKDDLRKAGVAEAVNKCGAECAKFAKDLERWTRQSSSTKLSFGDRFIVGVWHQEKIRTLNTRLEVCTAIVHHAVARTQLMVQVRSEKLSEAGCESLKTQLSMLETEIQGHHNRIRSQKDEAEQRLQWLEEQYNGTSEDDVAIDETRKQLELLEEDEQSSNAVLSQARGTRTQVIRKILTTGSSKAVIGMTESAVGKIDQHIEDATTRDGSTTYLGIFRNDLSG